MLKRNHESIQEIAKGKQRAFKSQVPTSKWSSRRKAIGSTNSVLKMWTNAVLLSPSVTSTLIARITVDRISVPVKLDLPVMGKRALMWTNAVLLSPSVTSTLIARITVDRISVPVKLDLPVMGKRALMWTNAVLLFPSVTSTPIATIPVDHIGVPVKLDLPVMGKRALVRE
ncbi:hypothetical protein ACROYT_G030074 [Oculina patagonica]